MEGAPGMITDVSETLKVEFLVVGGVCGVADRGGVRKNGSYE